MYREVIFIGRYKKFDSTLSTQGHHYNRVSIKQEYTLLEYPSQDSIHYRKVSITRDIHRTIICPACALWHWQLLPWISLIISYPKN